MFIDSVFVMVMNMARLENDRAQIPHMMDAHIERSLARLVSEQTRLLKKPTALTDAEKSEFRVRAKKITLLMRRTRNVAAK